MRAARTQYSPLTPEERLFAEQNHYLVDQFLYWNRLQWDDWYDVVICRYVLSVKKWLQRADLHKYKFSTIVRQDLRSAVGYEREKQSREIQTISLEEIIPGTDGVTYMDTITADNLDYINYGEEDMDISYNVKLPPKGIRGGMKPKGDDVIALENFISAKSHKNMSIGYDSTEEAKKRTSALQAYKRKWKLQEEIDIYRIDSTVYVVKNKGGKKA